MTLDNAIEKILTGNCLLFTGSGFNLEAINIMDKEFVLGNNLANVLYERCGIFDHDNDLKNASELFLDENSEFELIEMLKNEFTVKYFSGNHEFIGSLPWKRVYTTNYDLIIEQSYNKSGKLLTPISLTENIDQYKDFRKLCIHLNGHINNLTPYTINREFKLTNASYLTTDFANSQWVDLFRSDIHTCDVIVFIGFSNSNDIDISRILAEKISTIKEKCFFIVSETESELNIKKLSKFGQPIKIGLNGFVDTCKKIKEEFQSPEQYNYYFKSFEQFSLPQKLLKNKDIDFHNLVLKGDISFELIHQSIIDSKKTPYFIYRESIEDLFSKRLDGITNFVIQSGLGNGKTCFIYGLASLGLSKGCNVYLFNQYYDITVSEVERICSSTGENIVIIENYSNHLDLIEKFNLFRRANTTLVLTERSIINDTVYDTLEEIIGETYYTYNLNHLSFNEASIFSELLSSYGLWGKYSSLSNDQKNRKIRDDFSSSIRLTLLDVLKSPDIQKRLTNLVDSLFDNKPFYHAGLLIISSNIFGFTLTLEDLIYILDDELLNNPSFYNNDKLKEFIDFDNNKIKITSSILAEGILHTNQYHADLIPLLIKVAKKLDQARFNKNNFNKLRLIISHSRLQKLFNTTEHNNFRQLVIQFFEEVKSLEYSKKNPFFWLQYAMARLEIRDYKIADQYFNTAYSWANKLDNFDTFQLDNHYARLLLENEIYNGDLETCMEQFLKAHKILSNRTDKNRNRHFPIKVARNYSRFYDHYFRDLELQDKKVFLVSCQEILHRIDDYNAVTEERNRHRVARECFDSLSSILLKERAILK